MRRHSVRRVKLRRLAAAKGRADGVVEDVALSGVTGTGGER